MLLKTANGYILFHCASSNCVLWSYDIKDGRWKKIVRMPKLIKVSANMLSLPQILLSNPCTCVYTRIRKIGNQKPVREKQEDFKVNYDKKTNWTYIIQYWKRGGVGRKSLSRNGGKKEWGEVMRKFLDMIFSSLILATLAKELVCTGICIFPSSESIIVSVYMTFEI